jgi:activating signal cointegrator 1
VRALTLTQPWASLIAVGAKRLETRAWRTDYTGPLAIHASKEIVFSDSLKPEFIVALGAPLPLPDSGLWRYSAALWSSSIVCVVNLVGCVRTEHADRIPGVALTDQERRFGNFTRGRWALILRDVQPLQFPVRCSGSQGLWDLPVSVADQIEKQLKVVAL